MKTIKIFFNLLLLSAALCVAFSCENENNLPTHPNVIVGDGPVDLVDQQFGMYYGDKNNNNTGVYNVVLSDAICFRDGYGNPYLDSEGDMLVLEFNCELQEPGTVVMLPEGEYEFTSEGNATKFVNTATSYVKRLSGDTQYHYSILSGSVTVTLNGTGGYDLMTNDMVISYAGETYEVLYSYNGNIAFEEWSKVAVNQQGMNSDIIDIPFTDVVPTYFGDLFGYQTGNYVMNFTTDELSRDDYAPGIMLTMNMFGKLLRKAEGEVPDIVLPSGTYTVYPSFNSSEFSMLYGMDMNGTPFGTYVFQQDTKGTQSLEYIGEGSVEVSSVGEGADRIYTLVYEFKTALKRTVKGTWVGPLNFSDASVENDRLVLSTLDGPVECDMYRIEKGYLTHIETLHTTSRDNPIDIADVWQVWLEPRLWNAEEKELDWDERIQKWNPNGDVMLFEFVTPLGNNGDIAPEMDKEYVYQIQPNLDMEEDLYLVSTSKFGRPYDDIFYEPLWTDYTYMTGWDTRRGFTWDGGFRGVWYMHYIEGTWQNLDETAPAVSGTVKVTRTSDIKFVPGGLDEHQMPALGGLKADFKLVWELYDDAVPANKISGEWSGPLTVVTSAIGDEEEGE